MSDTFKFLIDNFRDRLTTEGWLDEARRAVESWNGA